MSSSELLNLRIQLVEQSIAELHRIITELETWNQSHPDAAPVTADADRTALALAFEYLAHLRTKPVTIDWELAARLGAAMNESHLEL